MSAFFDRLCEYISTAPFPVTRVAVIEGDGEPEYRDFIQGPNCMNTYSVAKSFTMTGIGLLYDDGLLKPEDRILDILEPDIPAGMDPRWHDTTIDMALTHRIGLPGGFLDIDVECSAHFTEDYLRYTLSHPLTCDPGSAYCYTDAAFYLLARVCEKLTGENLENFLWKRLFLPLGFQEAAWSHCPQGHAMGGTGLYLHACDIAKLGALYLNGGVHAGRRLISREWTEMAVDRGYTLTWDSARRFYSKGGMYGQYISVDPGHRRVIAVQSFGGDPEAVADAAYGM